MEHLHNCETPARPKKRIPRPKTWKKTVNQAVRYKLVPPAAITCNHNSKTLKCATLTTADRNHFNEAVYKKPNRKYQHDFLLKHMHFSAIQRRRGTGKYSPKTFRTKYTVLNMRMVEVPVCMKTFMAITRYSKNTLLYIANKYHIRNGMIDDERGGFRQEKQFELITDSIKTFVSKLNFVETHYCRGRTEKKYLPSELNLTKLYNLYMESIKENSPLPPDSGISIKLSYFRHVVQTSCNISFKMPQQDACSTCLQFRERINNESKMNKGSDESEEFVNLRAQFAIHKKRATAYYEILKSYDPNVYICSYDCQKNLPMPKIPDGATYYSRQLYFQNFTIVSGNSHTSLTPANVTSYCWTENQYNRNSNLIASCVFHHLQKVPDWSSFRSVTLVSDGCAGQNKNSSMLAMLAYWLLNYAPSNIEEVRLLFPVTGHSFIPPDRVFAQIEKKLKRKEKIEQVDEITDIVSAFSAVQLITEEAVPIYDFKKASEICCKTPAELPFQISQCKRIFFRRDSSNRNNILVKGELFYYLDTAAYASLFKKRKNGSHLQPAVIPEQNKLDKKKKDDIDALLKKHYGDDWRANENLALYSYVLDVTLEENGPNDENEELVDDPEPICEPQDADITTEQLVV